MSIKDRSKRIIAGGAAAVGLTLGVAMLAGAASPTQSAPPAAEQQDVQDPSLNGSIQVPEGPDSQSEADEAKSLQAKAKISPQDAEKAAQAKVPGGTIGKVELGNENGTVIYSVEMTDAGKSVDVKVDAGNGSVLAADSGADEAGDSQANEAPDANEAPEAGGATPTTTSP